MAKRNGFEHEPDRMGFIFDPFDIQFSPGLGEFITPLLSQPEVKFTTEDHIRELSYLQSHEWVDTHGQVVRMDKMKPKHLHYLVNIVKWMDKHDHFTTPYKDTIQYAYARKRVVKLNRIVEACRQILSRPMGWSITTKGVNTAPDAE